MPQYMATMPQYQAPTPQYLTPLPQQHPIQAVPASPTQVPMQMPVNTRTSTRANKGKTSRYDDFVQQITLTPGRYAYDGSNLYRLEDTSIANHHQGNMMIYQNYDSGFLNNDVSGSYEAFRP